MDALLQSFVDRLAQISFVQSAAIAEDAQFDDPHRDGTVTLTTPAGTSALPYVFVESPVIRSRLGDVFAAAAAHPSLIVLTQSVGPTLGDLLEQRAINFVDLDGNCHVTVGTRYIARRQSAKRTRQAASASAKQPSELYQRYNGFMLGFWAMFLPLDALEPRYERYRLHLHDLMNELGLAWRMPERHADYAQASDRAELLIEQLERIGGSMIEFFVLGTDTLHVLLDPASDASRAAYERVMAVAQRHELDRELLEAELGRNWHDEVEEEHLFDEVVSRAYRVAGIALDSCLSNPASCFVITPFAEPFRGYYASFYRPALTLAGYESLRAWEGASSEAYVALVQKLMRQCGAALADLSPVGESGLPSGNVVHEVGLSMGLGNTTYLVRDARESQLPSNLIGLTFLNYDPTEPGWPDEHAVGLAVRIREQEQSRDGEA